ncbi:type IV pilus twitching motility protein PilT [Deinococcus multiflagellatus]|uniref:Type IV pilus twitching motility protein PilT n=1 Tax=Deinococcus multiflagellatus TaxID=1656887 RepID=A0ABW1ZSH5_9DEIO
MTGATGSGKSTTLAAMIRHFNDSEEGHIVTIEDPIEFIHRENKSIIHQRLVGPDNDTPTFLDGVEDAMRQAPDIILLGEVRDKETMTAALQAAETGHLVFCTLHTRDAPTTMQRVLGFYGAGEKESVRHQFANSLVAIISQQLVKRTQPDKQGRMRQLIMEVLQPNMGVRSIMRDETKAIQLIRDAQKSSGDLGNVTMDDQLILAAQQGVISNEQAMSRSIMRETVEKGLKDGRVGRTA